MRCSCGIETKTEDIQADEAKEPRRIVCKGCGRGFYIRGPSCVSHDNPTCDLFNKTCSHRLVAMHPMLT